MDYYLNANLIQSPMKTTDINHPIYVILPLLPKVEK